IALVVPPSFVDASRHQPRRVLTYSSPITGATGKGLLSHTRFLLAAPGFIHSVLTYGLSTNRPFSGRNKQLLLVPSKLLLYSIVCNCVVHDIPCKCMSCQGLIHKENFVCPKAVWASSFCPFFQKIFSRTSGLNSIFTASKSFIQRCGVIKG